MKINSKSKNLAINGGVPTRKIPWKDNFTFDFRENLAAFRAISSGYLSLFEGSPNPDPPFSFDGGPEVQGLEDEWSDFYKIKYCVSVNSATSGLFAAIGALGIGFGDEVIVSPYTMTACAMAPMIYGSIPVFADVDENTGCLDANSIITKISERTKAIIVVHQFGFPANMVKIMEIAKKYDLKVIEDCAQAHGGIYNNQFIGTFGDIGVFSLNVNKTIQCGEGGICVTNSSELDYKLRLIRNHGEAVISESDAREFVNIAGFNYRMTEVTAAIAREQLKKLNYLNEKRLDLVNYFKEKLKNFEFLSPFEGPSICKENRSVKIIKSVYYIFPIKFLKNEINVSRQEFINLIKSEGVLFYGGYVKPLYLQSVYQNKALFKFGYPFSAKQNVGTKQIYNKGTCPTAERLHFNETLISEHIRLPHKKKDIDDIINAIQKICSG